MNATLQCRLEDSYEETLCYISTIVDATIYCLSGGQQSKELIPIDQERLLALKKWMDVIFLYQ